MKKNLSILFAAILMASFIGCSKDDDSGNNPTPEKTYTVEYKFEVNENHGNIKLIYYGPSLDMQEVENPASPWETSLADFKQGDSVYFHYEIIPLENTTLTGSWKVTISGDGYDNSNGTSFSHHFLGTVNPVSGSWSFKLP